MKRFSFKPALTLKGREFRGARGLAGKPFHPPLTDVPIGAYVIAPVLDFVSLIFRNEAWSHNVHLAAGYVFLGGAIVSVFTALTGYFDWLDTEKGTQIRRTANSHAWTMIFMTLLVVTDLVYRFLVSSEVTSTVPLAALGLVILGLAVIGGTIGGSMVYDYGFNVEVAGDSPVWHKSEKDIVHPKSDEPTDPIRIPEPEKRESIR